jgi:Fe-S oxidoreductase, related to NifB/MoaA family
MVLVFDVAEGSPAYRAGIKPGDYIVAVNGNDIDDVLDYSFYTTETKLRIRIHREAELFDVLVRKGQYTDLGLQFETFLMDKQRTCNNKCIFCFVDQVPPGLRDTLYFKDDDARMSFISGSYITLTNLDDKDVDRIVKMKTSPMNISVHTTNPKLRVKMLNNRFAGKAMDIMRRFAEVGIKLNCQIVLCKGINDGDELDRTMNDLESLYPGLNSVSIVPAGLTKYREKLFPLMPYTVDECKQIIEQVQNFAEKCLEKHGERLFYCGDELYIKAGMRLPNPSEYDGYPQLENGVGMMASMYEEFEAELRNIDDYKDVPYRQVSIATGAAAYEFISMLAEKLVKSTKNLSCTVYMIQNDFFGEEITVSGLITGQDLLNQLKYRALGERLYIPSSMLRHEQDMFLDNMTLKELSRALDIEIRPVPNDGAEFISALLS